MLGHLVSYPTHTWVFRGNEIMLLLISQPIKHLNSLDMSYIFPESIAFRFGQDDSWAELGNSLHSRGTDTFYEGTGMSNKFIAFLDFITYCQTPLQTCRPNSTSVGRWTSNKLSLLPLIPTLQTTHFLNQIDGQLFQL